MEPLYASLWFLSGFLPWIIFVIVKLGEVKLRDIFFALGLSIFGPGILAIILILLFLCLPFDKVLWKSKKAPMA